MGAVKGNGYRRVELVCALLLPENKDVVAWGNGCGSDAFSLPTLGRTRYMVVRTLVIRGSAWV